MAEQQDRKHVCADTPMTADFDGLMAMINSLEGQLTAAQKEQALGTLQSVSTADEVEVSCVKPDGSVIVIKVRSIDNVKILQTRLSEEDGVPVASILLYAQNSIVGGENEGTALKKEQLIGSLCDMNGSMLELTFIVGNSMPKEMALWELIGSTSCAYFRSKITRGHISQRANEGWGARSYCWTRNHEGKNSPAGADKMEQFEIKLCELPSGFTEESLSACSDFPDGTIININHVRSCCGSPAGYEGVCKEGRSQLRLSSQEHPSPADPNARFNLQRFETDNGPLFSIASLAYPDHLLCSWPADFSVAFLPAADLVRDE
jgi:hypothetical protein